MQSGAADSANSNTMSKNNLKQRNECIPLLGQFFHSIGKDHGKVEWQGVIIGNPEPGWYLLQLFEWMLGEQNVRRLVRIEDMEHWLFYENAEAMSFSYEHGSARAGGPYRDRVSPEQPD